MKNQSSEPFATQQDQDLFQIQLSQNRKKMLQHYYLTGQILSESSETEGKFNTRKSHSRLSNPFNCKLILSTVHQLDEQYLQSAYYNLKSRLNETQIKKTQRKSFIDKLEERQANIRRFENLIVAMMFDLKLVDKLQDDLGLMLEEAEENYSKRSKKIVNSNNKTSSQCEIIFVSKEQQINKVKRELAHELAESLQILTKKRTYKKHCFYTYKIEKIEGSFALDFKHFVHKVNGKDSIRADSMEDYKGFAIGKTTKNFKKYLKKNDQPEDEVSFSLIFSNRTLDLSSETPQQRDQFIKALKQLERYL